ncbi:hypothetical protein [Lederbergia citri]|uniref:Uncharacterized protein n=1 Tax=Lederbergia citri TaxID=2833580 RepID=A0A942TG43_9BACI|nr:hypothetical protein [Lederbergia citri]MBS4197033.1 hypothetical protein [Lederbergia citri]
MKKLAEIEYFCKLLFEAVGVPTYFINKDSDTLWQFTNIKAHPLYEEPISHLGIFSTKKEFSIITSSPLAEDYFLLKIEAGVILLGPTID